MFVYLGYVESMKNLLFRLPKGTLKEVAERYSAKVPKPHTFADHSISYLSTTKIIFRNILY